MSSSPQTNPGTLSPQFQLSPSNRSTVSLSGASAPSSASSLLLRPRAPQHLLQSVWRVGPGPQTGIATDDRREALQPNTAGDSTSVHRRVRRRGSHPQLSQSQYREAVDNGDFIKAAFEKLTQMSAMSTSAGTSSEADEGVRRPPQRKLMPALMASGTPIANEPNQGRQQWSHHIQDTSQMTLPDISLIEMLHNDDPLGVGVTVRRNTAGNASRSSIGSGISTAFTFPDRTSIVSSRPLLQSDRNSTASYGGSSIATTSAAATPQMSHYTRHEGSASLSSAAPHSRPSESSATWSDPFDDERAQNLRRRSTISGYSVGSADWNSLRRGSLASTGNNSSGSHSNQGPQGAHSGPPTVVSARWEAWIAAYRDSMLASAQGSLPTHHEVCTASPRVSPYLMAPVQSSLEGRMSAIRIKRASFPTDAIPSAGSGNEQINLFHSLRRQFVARPGSRSETNRLLIIELCHGLEQYSKVLAALWKLCKPSGDVRSRQSSPRELTPCGTTSVDLLLQHGGEHQKSLIASRPSQTRLTPSSGRLSKRYPHSRMH